MRTPEAQQLFRSLSANARPATGGSADPKPVDRQAMARLLEIQKHAAAGQFRIVDAHIVPGVADPAPYAQQMGGGVVADTHTFEEAPEGKSSVLGELRSIRFAVTLWLPEAWVVPASLQAWRAVCPD